MNIETRIKLDRFQPRPYQLPICDAIENKGYKRVLAILPRRAGKDIVAFNLCVRAALKEVQTIFYIFPTFSQGRRILWDCITTEGHRLLDYYCPTELADRNEQLMRLRFVNGSVIQIIGSNDYDTALVGTNAKFMVFSEYSLQDPRAYQYARPILTASNGVALFLSTPRGRNHLFDLYQIAKNSKDWFCYKLTVDETQHVDIGDIRKEIELGEISEELSRQEYWCDFDVGQDQMFYASILDKMRLEGRISTVPWEPGYKTHTAWDLGILDPTVILWFQVIGATIHIIDCYSASNRAIDHFVNVVLNKPYTYGKHFPPHDIMVREQGSGLTRREMYKRLGINFSEIYDIDLLDGIECVKSSLSKIWIDESKCKDLIKWLYRYKQEKDPVTGRFKGIPVHDDASHHSDAMRYLCIALKKASFEGTTPEQLDRRYREAIYGGKQTTGFFREDI
jgi:phage terminase large subunit